MRPRNYTTEGIILSRRKFGEADRIIYIFTKDFGKKSLIAKGIRRTTSRKRGHLEVFNHIKFSGVKGEGMDLLIEAETTDSFDSYRKNLKKVSVAYYLVEIVNRTTVENEQHSEIFDLLLAYLNLLKTTSALKKIRLDFAARLLTSLGFWPKGQPLDDPDRKIEEVIEKKLGSIRVGRKLLS